MSRDTLDAVLASSPQSSTAAKVTARGEHFEPAAALPPNYPHWKAPPPMRAYAGPDRRGETPNFTGRKLGRLTVLGILHNHAAGSGKNRGLRWVVRCACGDYEVRGSSALKRLASISEESPMADRCFFCCRVEINSRRYKKHGGRPIEDFFKPVGTP